MKHAGAVSDLIWAIAVELPLLAEQKSLGLKRYARFRDDIFVTLEDTSHIQAIRIKFESLASKYCEVKLEPVSLA